MQPRYQHIKKQSQQFFATTDHYLLRADLHAQEREVAWLAGRLTELRYANNHIFINISLQKKYKKIEKKRQAIDAHRVKQVFQIQHELHAARAEMQALSLLENEMRMLEVKQQIADAAPYTEAYNKLLEKIRILSLLKYLRNELNRHKNKIKNYETYAAIILRISLYGTGHPDELAWLNKLHEKFISATDDTDVNEDELINFKITNIDPKLVSPRVIFLEKKIQYLEKLTKLSELIDKNVESKPVLKRIFNMGKKITDLFDDIWSGLRRIIVLPSKSSKIISSILIGGSAILLGLVEAQEGFSMAYKAYQQKKQDFLSRLKFGGGSYIGVNGLMVVSLGLSYLIGNITTVAAISPLFLATAPLLIPGFLLCSFIMKFAINVTTLKKNMVAETKAKHDYHLLLDNKNKELAQINGLLELIKKNISVVDKQPFKQAHARLLNKQNLEEEQKTLLNQYDSEDKLLNRIGELQNEIGIKKVQYKKLKEKRIDTKRKTIFNSLEIIGMALVFIGSVGAPLGLVPLIWIGAGLAITAMAFEFADELADHRPTSAIRKFFNKFGKVQEPENCAYNCGSTAQLIKQNEQFTPVASDEEALHNLTSTDPETQDQSPTVNFSTAANLAIVTLSPKPMTG